MVGGTLNFSLRFMFKQKFWTGRSISMQKNMGKVFLRKLMKYSSFQYFRHKVFFLQYFSWKHFCKTFKKGLLYSAAICCTLKLVMSYLFGFKMTIIGIGLLWRSPLLFFKKQKKNFFVNPLLHAYMEKLRTI